MYCFNFDEEAKSLNWPSSAVKWCLNLIGERMHLNVCWHTCLSSVYLNSQKVRWQTYECSRWHQSCDESTWVFGLDVVRYSQGPRTDIRHVDRRWNGTYSGRRCGDYCILAWLNCVESHSKRTCKSRDGVGYNHRERVLSWDSRWVDCQLRLTWTALGSCGYEAWSTSHRNGVVDNSVWRLMRHKRQKLHLLLTSCGKKPLSSWRTELNACSAEDFDCYCMRAAERSLHSVLPNCFYWNRMNSYSCLCNGCSNRESCLLGGSRVNKSTNNLV